MAGPGMETPNELMVVFSNTVTAGFDALSGSVNGVFGLLIALVVALTGIQWALSPNREVLASGFGKVLLIGAFAWIINDWQALSETLYAGFLELGLTAGGGSLSREEFLNPGAILQQGWEIVKALGETPAPVENPLDVMGNMADALILGLAMIGIMLAFAILALQIIVSLLEFKIVTLGGFVLLPFGIWNKTAFLAERPLGYVVSSGLKVLALAIVVSGARTIFDQLQPIGAQLQAANLPQDKIFSAIGERGGLIDFFAARGIAKDQAAQCLANSATATKLADATSKATDAYNVTGTPTFLVNGKNVEVATWDALEPILQQAGAR